MPAGDSAARARRVDSDFRMTCITFGTPNAARSNAVLLIHGLRGNRDSQSTWAGPGKAFDTSQYFVIQPDTLASVSPDPNATTSPTRAGLGMRFPRFSNRDVVQAEHRMLTECLRLSHLVAVSGTSMGGIESMQWAVSYPDFMDAVIRSCPRRSRQDSPCSSGRPLDARSCRSEMDGWDVSRERPAARRRGGGTHRADGVRLLVGRFRQELPDEGGRPRVLSVAGGRARLGILDDR